MSPGTDQYTDTRQWIRTCNSHPDDEIFILVASTTAREFGPIGIPRIKRVPSQDISLGFSQKPKSQYYMLTRICAHVKLPAIVQSGITQRTRDANEPWIVHTRVHIAVERAVVVAHDVTCSSCLSQLTRVNRPVRWLRGENVVHKQCMSACKLEG